MGKRKRSILKIGCAPSRGVMGLLLAGLVLLLVACGAEASPRITSPESSPTVPPSPTATPVEVAVFSPTELPTSTLVPTATRPPRGPATAGPSPTSPLRPTFTPAPPTLTATPPPTEFGFNIEYFTTISQTIAPGDNVTLAWSVIGAEEIVIYRLGLEGEREREWPVQQREGRITVSTNPASRETAEFVLVAQRGSRIAEEVLSIEVNCAAEWFFSPAPEGCPSLPPEPSLQVEQRFEGGRMIWVATTRTIYVLFNDDQQPRWIRVPDTFEEGEPERDDSFVPPPGLSQPVRGFGKVWRTNPTVRDRLGWAVEPEAPYDGVLQAVGFSDSPTAIYMRTRDGGIVELLSGGRNWQFLGLEAEE